MKTVRINREKLIEAVESNLLKHQQEFDEALDGYHEQQQKALQQALRVFRKTQKMPQQVVLPVPVSYEAEYLRALDMLRYSVDSVIELDANEFEQLVRDNWSWKRAFTAASAMYSKS